MPDPLPPPLLRAAYDLSASRYDARFAAVQAPKHEAALARARPGTGARVLDLGGGTGALLARLGPHDPPPVLLDLSLGMLRHARGAPHRVQGDWLRLPLRAGAFDLVYALTALLLPRDLRPRAFAELARVLAPGGRAVVTVLRADADPGLEPDLAGAGLTVTDRFACGQDTGWVATRAR